MIARYKEIWFGAAIGANMCLLDAMMHASMHGQLSVSSMINDLLEHNATQIFFRSLFIIISMAFGFALWLSNKHKGQAEGLQATINSFHGRIAHPLMIIAGYAHLLSGKEGWPLSREEAEMIREIQRNAQKINDVIDQLPPPGTPYLDAELAGVATKRSA